MGAIEAIDNISCNIIHFRKEDRAGERLTDSQQWKPAGCNAVKQIVPVGALVETQQRSQKARSVNATKKTMEQNVHGLYMFAESFESSPAAAFKISSRLTMATVEPVGFGQ